MNNIYLVRYAKMKFADIINMRDLKHAISRILGIDFYRIQLYFRDDVRREEPLPDWSDAFGDVVACISHMTDPIPHPRILHSEVKVIVDRRRNSFIICIHSLSDQSQLLQQISEITSIPSEEMVTKDQDGNPWRFPDGMARTPIVCVHPVRRGGMRSVSSTQPFEGNEVNDEQEGVPDQDMKDEPYDSEDMEFDDTQFPHWPHDDPKNVNGRDEDRSRSPRRQREWSAADNLLECLVWPRAEEIHRPPLEQKPLMLKGERIALVKAYKEAKPGDVLAQLHLKLKPMRPILCLPQHADAWEKPPRRFSMCSSPTQRR